MSNSTNDGFLDVLLARDKDADYLENAPPWRVGISMAATWSWGAAVAVAIAVMHTKGLGPYLVWMGANFLGIPLFGLGYTYIPGVKKWKNLLPMLGLWLFIGFFAIVMNLSALKAALGGGPDIVQQGLLTPNQSLWAVIGVGLLIAWFIHKKGLKGSVATDVYQLGLQFIGAIGIIAVGLVYGTGTEVPWMVGDQSSWMVTAVLGLITACFASGMQWQRIEAVDDPKDKLYSTFWGGGIFTVFLSIVTLGGYYFWDGSMVVTIPFMIAVIAVATSTGDSGSALLQYVSKRFSLPASAGSVMTLAAVVAFPYISQMGVTGIWTFYASTRWKIVAALLAGTLVYQAVPPLRDSERLHALARKTRFVIPATTLASGRQKQPTSADD